MNIASGNTELLLIGIENWIHLLGVIVSATIAMLLFAAATQGYWLVRSRWWESIALLLVAFTLFRPGFNKPSRSRTFISAFTSDPMVMDTNINGGRRACS